VEAVELSRRELLTLFLGAPFAAAACRNNEPLPLPPGELVGASDTVGHRLRSHAHARPGPDAWSSHEVVIVGAGVAGLAAAWRLRHAGVQDVVVLELESAAGGTSRSGTSSVSAFPWGAHYVPAPMAEDRLLARVLGEAGVVERMADDGTPVIAEEFLVRDPSERVFYRGRWYEGLYLHAGATNDDLRQLAAFDAEIGRWANWRDAKVRRAFAIPTAAGSDDAEVLALDRMTMGAWLDAHGWHSPRLRWLVDYACRDDYGMHADAVSAWAGVFYFAARVPAAGKPSQPLVTWPEGNGRLVRLLATSVNVESGWLVTEVDPAAGEVIALARDGREVRGIQARHVVFAGPQFIAAHVVRDRAPATGFTYGSWLVANLTLRDRPQDNGGFPLSWDNILYDSPGLGYVVATHQRGSDYGPTVLTYYHPLCDADPRHARERLLAAGRDQWAEVALADLGRAHPDLRRLTTRLDVMRWGHAMVRPTPGLFSGGALQRARMPQGNVHFAHSDLSGLALFEEALHHGVRAAEEVLVARGDGVRTFL
jgi:glycine/D-amino acid oxidase-like deaminating enzyme